MLAHMTSWRDTTSEAAQHDLDGLLNAVLPFAEQTLAKYGEMFPFGAAVSSEGVVEMMAADVGQGDQPPSAEILDLLYEGARESADTRRAVAFVADVRIEGGDAIRIELEHREGTSLELVIPYTRSRFRKNLSLGQMSGGVAESRIWSDS
jgi:hypothetical protein